MAVSAKTRTIMVERSNGTMTRIEGIPSDAKITFGQVNPGKQGYSQDYCLRIYTSRENQLAVVTHVTSFRDMDLVFSERKRNKKATSAAVTGFEGLEVKSVYEDSYGEWEPLSD